MRCLPLAACALASLPAAAQTERLARPELVLKTVVPGMPTGPQQEIRVMTAMIKPGELPKTDDQFLEQAVGRQDRHRCH